jgi:glycosyltransferase involved in cell wall biosynthesis
MSGLVAVPADKALSNVSPTSHTAMGPRPMSVAIYLHDLTGGGVERQSLIIAEEFRRDGMDVTLLLHRLRGQLLDQVPAGVRVVDLHSSRTLLDIPRLARWLRAEQPDILLSNVDLNNVAALLAKVISFSRTKVVICQHNPISDNFAACENWMYRYVSLFYRLLSPLVSHAVAVSEGVGRELCAIAGLPREHILTINNPVIGPDFRERSEQTGDHPWFHDHDRPVFVTAGRLVAQKDHDTMLRALAIHRKHVDSRLIILGVGPLENALRVLAAELNISDAVDFIGFRANSLPFLRQADAFLLSSRCEGFGNVLVEALGCGTPVISTSCEYGPSEILENGRYGTLVQPRNPVALAAAMDEVRILRERFPTEVLRHRAADFSYTACTSRYTTMFKALVPNRVWAA